jgi:AraC-like DNA-binding protein
VNLRDDEVKLDSRHNSPRPIALRGMAVSGAYSGVFTIDATQHAAMMGVHFKPGGACAVLGVPASELADTHVEAADLWGDRVVGELRGRLCAAESPRERFQIMEAALTSRLGPTRQQHPLVQFALTALGPDGAGMQVCDVAQCAGVSHRTLINIFTKQVGLPPKVYCRIRRFRSLHRLAQRSGTVDWAQLALACGFYDQSHLANEVRKLSGLTPTEYFRQLQATRNALPGHIAAF